METIKEQDIPVDQQNQVEQPIDPISPVTLSKKRRGNPFKKGHPPYKTKKSKEERSLDRRIKVLESMIYDDDETSSVRVQAIKLMTELLGDRVPESENNETLQKIVIKLEEKDTNKNVLVDDKLMKKNDNKNDTTIEQSIEEPIKNANKDDISAASNIVTPESITFNFTIDPSKPVEVE